MVVPWEGTAPIAIVASCVASRRLATTSFIGYLPPRRLKTCGYRRMKNEGRPATQKHLVLNHANNPDLPREILRCRSK